MFFFKMSRHMTLEKRWIASCEAVGRWMPFKSDMHLQQHVPEVPNASQLASIRPCRRHTCFSSNFVILDILIASCEAVG